MPKKISLSEGREIEYIYDAAGVKLAKIIKGGGSVIKRTDYAGSYVYKDKTYDYRIFSHGREVFNRGAWEYEYHIKDHLGNVRVAFSESGTVKQENHYYPFGLRIADLGMNNPLPSDNKYLYNGKEMQDDFGLDWLDYGARMYDAEIGRWHVADPMSEERYWVSSYQYVQNNPIARIDPNGMLDDWIIRGNDGHEVRIVAPGDDVTFNVDADLGQSETIDLAGGELENYAFGYQTTLSGEVSGHGKTSGGAFVNQVTFFDDNYGGYWYTYVGAEGELGGGSPSISADAEKSFLFGIRQKNGTFGPEAFAGDYNYVVASASSSEIKGKGGIDVDVFAQVSIGEQWTVIEIGASAGFDLVPGASKASVAVGRGTAKLITE